MTTLISFLGKSQLDSKTGYRSARYRFEDGSERETAYFGLALADYLRSGTLILLGTPSSQWDLLVESVVGDAAQEEQRIELLDAVRADSVNEDLLRQLAPSIERKVGRSVQALIIPHAVSFAEQQALLARLAAAIARGERVAIDLTHGYRHLAMLGLAAARYLAHERDIVIEGLYYGALDMTRDGITPVIRLDGLAHVEEWAEAFAAYEAGGDLSRFVPLLARDGFPQEAANALTRGWQNLALTNVHDAARHLRQAHQALERPLAGASELYRERLRRSLRWATESTLSEKQRQLALQALNREDWLRGAILGLEAFISRLLEDTAGDPLDSKAREKADERFQQQLKTGDHPDWKRQAYWLLKNVRNALAHGTPPDIEEHRRLLHNPERLARELRAAIDRLFQAT